MLSSVKSSWAADAVPRTFREFYAASPKARGAGLEACLTLISVREPAIQAWVQVAPEAPTGYGSLSGIPFGAKDVFETKGLATEYGSSVYKGRVGNFDAAPIKELRSRGAVLLGKTQTAAFAYRTPPPTRNPRNFDHTPGGSSSGSAAAVAAGMVPFAIGTQTSGSTIRPASFCGIVGFKPTFGLFSVDGVLEFSRSLDTLGFFVNSAVDLEVLWIALGRRAASPRHLNLGVLDPLPDVEPEMASAFAAAISRLREHGFRLRAVDITPTLHRLTQAQRTIMFYEGARAHELRYRQFGDRLLQLANLVRDGRKISDATYKDALAYVASAREQLRAQFRQTPVILSPAAPGAAPSGLSSTGDSRMNACWTALGVPALTIPMPVREALPLGLQLTGDLGSDAALIHTAVRLERALTP
jgi:Asp-tRNA(Asn)/Glu-tRNA(Gln) amidotransferase A subunit family amidase